MRACATLLVLLFTAGGTPAQEVTDSLRTLLADGEFGMRSERSGVVMMYRFEVYRAPDSLVTVELQKKEVQLGGSASLATRQAVESSSSEPLEMPLEALRMLVADIARYDGVPMPEQRQRLQMGIESDGRVTFGIQRSVQGGLIVLVVSLLGALGVAGVFYAQSRRERRARLVLLEAQRAATASREAERLRIARDLHDGPVQQLHGLRLRMNTSPGEGEVAAHAATELQAVVREVRAIAEDLRPPALGPFGIAAALETLAERAGEQHPHVTVIPDIERGGPEPEGEVPLALFRIAQEAMNNAFEHADPSVVILRYRPAPLQLEITDDGVGFAMPADLGALRRDGHFGMVGIAERVELIGARLAISQGPGGGTRLRVTR